MQPLEFPPNFEHYPTHDQTHDGQEEVYTTLSGRITLQVGGEEQEVLGWRDPGSARVVRAGKDGVPETDGPFADAKQSIRGANKTRR